MWRLFRNLVLSTLSVFYTWLKDCTWLGGAFDADCELTCDVILGDFLRLLDKLEWAEPAAPPITERDWVISFCIIRYPSSYY